MGLQTSLKSCGKNFGKFPEHLIPLKSCGKNFGKFWLFFVSGNMWKNSFGFGILDVVLPDESESF